MSPWIRQHQFALGAALSTLRKAPGSFLFNVLVVAVALATHYGLGILFGMVLGFISAGFHYDTGLGVLAVVGLVFGLLLYVLSFHVSTQVFGWLAELRGWTTLLAHLIFGATASLLYWKLARRRPTSPRST